MYDLVEASIRESESRERIPDLAEASIRESQILYPPKFTSQPKLSGMTGMARNGLKSDPRWNMGYLGKLFLSLRIWGLPFDLITKETGRDIRNGIGKVVEVDNTAFMSEQARFIRICIKIPLDKPIRRRGMASSPEGDKIQIRFKYERLVGLCFHCGFFSHETKECSKPRDLSQEELSYGEWLKAGH
ncbi:hypothetical protein SO802_002347 [Lithocarpus litseifolius]|uniref:Zinc knuckle CX2CX4HX4C domain-containing protein n=1 Tax=Lithocarpus litseifolius TaxID=425828 RepID=A0AAW2E0L3_9ROSI